MSTIEKDLFEGGVRQHIKRQFVLIQRNQIDTNKILKNLAHQLQVAQYNVTIQGKNEISLKIDKKKNVPGALADVNRQLNNLLPNPTVDSKLLFSVLTSGNEIIVRVRRKNG